MTEYQYTREMADGDYNINNPNRVDWLGNQIRLSKEVEEELPGKTFTIKMFGESVTISFDQALSEEEKSTLDQVVQDHKDNA